MLEIKNINISFQRNIFNNTKIQFYDSHIHAIIGKSGSGKTTFLRSMIQDFPQLQMEMIYNNQIIDQKDDFVKEHIAYVDQLGSYFPNMSIKQHFSFYAQMKDEKIEESEIERFLNQVNLHHINIKKSPSVLSIGERKRFLIALALYCDKDIIILDEPTASLDKKNIILLKEVLLSLKNKMIILTTHTPEILEICDVIYKIENQQFEIEKQEIHDQNEMTDKVKKYHFSPIKYFQYKTPIQWIQLFGLVILTIFILLQVNNTIQTTVSTFHGNPILLNQSSKEMLFIRNRHGDLNIVYGAGYEPELAKPFTEEELNRIKEIEGIKSIYTFDVLPLYHRNNTVDGQNMTIIKKDGSSKLLDVVDMGSRAPAIFPYYDDNDFNNHDDGVYINQYLSEDFDIQEGDIIKAKFYIPSLQYDVKETNVYKKIAYTLEELELKVTKVLDEDVGYSSISTSYNIFIPYWQLNKILDEGLKNQNLVESSSVSRASQKVAAKPYSSSEYVIFIDKDRLSEIYSEILELNIHYDVSSRYLEHLSVAEIMVEYRNHQFLMMGGICAIGLIIFLIVQYFLIKSRMKELKMLMNIGINKKMVYFSLVFDVIAYGIICLVLGIPIIYIVLNQKILYTEMIPFVSVGICFMFCLINVCMMKFIFRKQN